jgi:hypothetical protein
MSDQTYCKYAPCADANLMLALPFVLTPLFDSALHFVLNPLFNADAPI